jgi:hypothetical protein
VNASGWKRKVRGGEVIDEISAFNYELGRRCFNLADYPCYLDLDRFDKDVVFECFRHKGPPVAVKHDQWPRFRNGTTANLEGYAFLPVSWNLAATDNALSKALLRMVKEERKRQGVKSSRQNEGNRNRPVSWSWLDLIDAPKRLKANDRSHLSCARQKAEQLRPEFLRCWAEIERSRTDRARLSL